MMEVNINKEVAFKWLGNGAQPSDTVRNLLSQKGTMAKFAEAKKAWESGEYTFAEFAKKFSDDTTSAVQEGSIGYVDKDSSLVKPFLDACLLLEEGQVSEWIESEYGYHLITVTSMDQAKIVEEPEFLEHILTFNENLENEVFWAELEAKNVKFNDTVVEQKIKEGLGLIKEGE